MKQQENVNVISEVVDHDRCCGCGICSGVCPSEALTMFTSANGDKVPRLTGECNEKCNLCLTRCPFASSIHNPREQNKALFGEEHSTEVEFDEDAGAYLECYLGHVSDEDIRSACASGGLATWVLATLFRKGLIDCAAVALPAKNVGNGHFEFRCVSSADEVYESSGSVYQPVDLSLLLREMNKDKSKRWAVIGVPCLCSAVRKAKPRQSNLEYVLGLTCGMYQNVYYTELLSSTAGLKCDEINSVVYRSKKNISNAGNFNFIVSDDSGKFYPPIPYKGLPYYLGRNGYFRVNACNYCSDVFAETADICFMDAWLSDYAKDPRGASLVIVRDQRLIDLFENEDSSAEIEVQRVPVETVTKSQKGPIRRKRKHLALRLNPKGGEMLSLSDRFDYWSQIKAQNRSKWLWGRLRAGDHRVLFWIGMADIVFVHYLIRNFIPKWQSRMNRLFGRK